METVEGRAWDLDVGEVFKKYKKDLFNFALTKGVTREQSEDLVQDVFESVLIGGRSSFRGESALKTWLIGILINKIADLYRAKASKKGQMIVNYSEFEENYFNNLLQGEDRRFSDDFIKDFKLKLENILSKNMLAVFINDFDGKDKEQCIDNLGISEGNYRAILSRAKAKVKTSKVLKKKYYNSIAS